MGGDGGNSADVTGTRMFYVHKAKREILPRDSQIILSKTCARNKSNLFVITGSKVILISL